MHQDRAFFASLLDSCTAFFAFVAAICDPPFPRVPERVQPRLRLLLGRRLVRVFGREGELSAVGLVHHERGHVAVGVVHDPADSVGAERVLLCGRVGRVVHGEGEEGPGAEQFVAGAGRHCGQNCGVGIYLVREFDGP